MRRRPSAVLACCLAVACAAHSALAGTHHRPGEAFYILRYVEAVELNGSSSDRDTLEEHTIQVSPAGWEVEYDLPKSTSAEDRERQWQFPARVLRSENGSLQLLNRLELVTRQKTWLKAAGLTEAACGHWYFTWNAFQVECDPESVVETIKGFDLGPEQLAEGSQYQDAQALGPMSLRAKGGGNILFGDATIDPEAVRRSRARTDVVTGEIMRKPVTPEAALHAHSQDRISGNISITFQVDEKGRPYKQTKVTNIDIEGPNKPEKRTVTQTLERRPIPKPST